MTELRIIQPEQGDQLAFGDILMNRMVRAADLPSQISVQEWMEGKDKRHL